MVFRFTRKVFLDLAISMVGFGAIMGIVFPFMLILMGVPKGIAFTKMFFTLCILAGLIVGAINITLAKIIVGKRLRTLTNRMNYVDKHLKNVSQSGEFNCTPENCYIKVDSDDELGTSAMAFNSLVDTLSVSLKTEIAIRQYTEMLTSHLKIDDLANKALRQLISISDAHAGAILIEISGELKLLSSTGIKESDLIVNNPILQDALISEKRSIVNLPSELVLDAVITEFRPKEVIVEPIKYKQVTLGLIVLASTYEFSPDILNTLDLFSQGLALALNNALTHDQVQKLAAIDPLTNIYNRRFGLIRLHEEFSRSIRNHTSLGVMMLDIDDFKAVNDTFGHPVGDKVIYHIASVIRSSIREGDIIMRYGGEEFMGVIIGASTEDVHKIAEKIRRVVQDSFVKHGQQKINTTISIGIAAYPENDVDSDQDLIEFADKALYTAKNTGKNKTVIYS